MEYFWTRLSEIRKLKSSDTFGCSETVLAAVKTIVHVFPNKEGIHTFLDDARRENEITNDDLKEIESLLPKYCVRMRPGVVESIVKIIQNVKLQLSAFITKPMTMLEKKEVASLTKSKCKCRKKQMSKFKKEMDELVWLRKDHARLMDIVKQVKLLL